MDKREFLTYRHYKLSDGREFDADIYRKSNNHGMTLRVVYGSVEVYTSSYISLEKMDSFVYGCFKKHSYQGSILNRPFMKEDIYIYVLGRKKYFTSDPLLKDNSLFFYVPTNMKDPLVKYKKLFLEYLSKRVVEIGKTMGRDLSDFRIRTGLFLSYYAVCFPIKKQFKFDYRLFAYTPEVMDCIIIHEIAHTYEMHHDEKFYDIVYRYCKNYDALERMVEWGRFEGGNDDYVF